MALDSFYEESAVNLNEKKQTTVYSILHGVQVVFVVLALLWGLFFMGFLPLPDESKGETFAQVLPDWIFFFMVLLSFITFAVICSIAKKRYNVSYDYVCVSGELRVSKVFNGKRRKLVCRLDPADILQIGDMDSPSYDRLVKTPGLKEVVCTPNLVAANGKFFMYVYGNADGMKKIFLLECRESLLVNMMQYLRRDVLDREYVPQAKKL